MPARRCNRVAATHGKCRSGARTAIRPAGARQAGGKWACPRPADWSAEWIAGPKRVDHDWRDFTFTADLTLTGRSIDLLFRAQPVGKTYGEAYVWTLEDAGKGPVLIEAVRHYPGGSSSAVKVTELRRVPLPAGMKGQGRHRVAIAARGDQLTTTIDGVVIDRVVDGSVTHGTVGFTAREANAAVIHRVSVTGAAFFETRFLANDNPFTGGDVSRDGLIVPGGVPKVDLVLPIEAPAPLVRRAFSLPAKRVTSARLYVAGAGWPRLSVNGRTIGTSAMASGFTAYDKSVLYQTYDVTAALRPGANAIGAELGRGWYGLTDPNEWYWHTGALAWRARDQGAARDRLRGRKPSADRHRYALADGLRPDPGRLPASRRTLRRAAAPKGWARPALRIRLDDRTDVQGPAGKLIAANIEPIAPVADVMPVAVKEVRPGAGLRLRPDRRGLDQAHVGGRRTHRLPGAASGRRGRPGDPRRRPDRRAAPDRSLHAGGRGRNLGTDFGYAASATSRSTAFPVRRIRHVTGRVAHCAVAHTGSFATAIRCLMRIDAAAIATIQNNMHGFQTDTPTYEKNGWTGDAQASAGAAARSLDVARVWTKWLADFRDAQSPKGEMPEIVPATPQYGYENSPGWTMMWGPTTPWDAATMILPWELYASYGDTASSSVCMKRRRGWSIIPAAGSRPPTMPARGLS